MWSYFNPFLKVHIKYPVWAGDCFLMIHNNNKCSFFFFLVFASKNIPYHYTLCTFLYCEKMKQVFDLD